MLQRVSYSIINRFAHRAKLCSERMRTKNFFLIFVKVDLINQSQIYYIQPFYIMEMCGKL